MIDISPLYDALNHRWKGVYVGPGYRQWDAIVQTPKGKLERKGRFETPEAAAYAVAEYYHSVYGADWPKALKTRICRGWRVRREKRHPYRAALHRGPSVIIWIADVRTSAVTSEEEEWYRITLKDLLTLTDQTIPQRVMDMWDSSCNGWKNSTIALIAIRIYKSITPRVAMPSPSGVAHG